MTLRALADPVGIEKIKALGQTEAGTITIPANTFITNIFVAEKAGNAVVGGLKFGTTLGAVDVVLAHAVTALGFGAVSLLKRVFGISTPQIIYFDAVTLWSSAEVDIIVHIERIY